MKKPFLLLLISLVLSEITAYLFKPSRNELLENVWNIIHLLQMLALIALLFYEGNKINKNSNPASHTIYILIITGLLFSFVGDCINSYLIDLTFIIKNQTILSALPFSIAHILYIRSNYLISHRYISDKSHAYFPLKKVRLITLLLWPVISVVFWSLLISNSAPEILKYISFGYAFMIGLMALSSVWVLNGLGKDGIIIFLGGIVFLCSDSMIGYFLLDGPNRPFGASQAIWITYYIAQLFIAHSPFIPMKSSSDAAGI